MAKKAESGFTVVELLTVILVLAGVGGWIANIVKLAGMSFDHFTGMLILRVVGIFLAPLGSVLGFI